MEGKAVDERLRLEGGLEDVVDARGLKAVAGGLLQLQSLEAEGEVGVALFKNLGGRRTNKK